MKNASLVGVVDGLGDEREVASSPRRRQRLLAHELHEVSTFHIVHRKIMPAFLLAGLMDGHDIRMAQVSRRLGFSAIRKRVSLGPWRRAC